MGLEEIKVRSQVAKEIANTLKSQSEETPYRRNELGSIMHGNGGDVYNSLFDVNTEMDGCSNVTRQMIECTARFLENAANSFLEADYAMAKEVSSS